MERGGALKAMKAILLSRFIPDQNTDDRKTSDGEGASLTFNVAYATASTVW